MISRTNYLFIFFILFGILSFTIAQTQKLNKIKTKGRWFVDADDRIILFRGINAVQKNFPWIPNGDPLVNMTNTTLLSLYKSWGFNAVRLGFMWSGLYPQKGQVNMTYVNEMMKIIDLLEYYGLYVIIDLHQDMMSSKFNSYDGMIGSIFINIYLNL
jgi:endoglycosylceramidase